jgi:hypothetical protein
MMLLDIVGEELNIAIREKSYCKKLHKLTYLNYLKFDPPKGIKRDKVKIKF